MSLCRWSSMDWRCDLYCYYDCAGGITTHVAGRRLVGDIPEVPSISNKSVSTKQWLKLHKKQMNWLETAKRVDIDLPYDGESFNDPDLESFKARLTELREIGYNFPDYLFDENEEPE